MNRATWIVAATAVSTLVAGCDKSGENAKKSDPAPLEYNYAYDKKEAYVADASNDLAALDQKISELSDKATAVSESFKTNVQVKILALRNQRAALTKKLPALKQATEANWNDAKGDFVKSYNEAKISCQQTWQWLTDKLGP